MVNPFGVRIVTWNLNQRVGVLPLQAEFLRGLVADVLCLQEVTVRTAPMLRQALSNLGYRFFVSTADECSSGPRRYGLAIAARTPIERRVLTWTPVWPERLLSVEGELGAILTTHIPPGATNGFVKVEMLEAALEEFRAVSCRPAILAGDFNAPQEEFPELVTWAQRRRRDGEWVLIPSRRERWDKAERRFVDGTLIDAFRHLHPAAKASS